MASKAENIDRPAAKRPDRTTRLEEALRANLKKRKDQARARGGTQSRDSAESASKSDKSRETGDGGSRT